MEQYISKSAVVAEIESKIEKYTKRGEESDAKRDGHGMYWGGVLSCLNEVRTLCDTIEVKEVDFEKEIKEEYLKHRCYGGRDNMLVILNEPQFNKIAKHFFELGVRTKDVNEIIKTAEDHAYFAGSENTREKLIDKACEWLSQTDFCHYYNKEFIDNFRKAMEE